MYCSICRQLVAISLKALSVSRSHSSSINGFADNERQNSLKPANVDEPVIRFAKFV